MKQRRCGPFWFSAGCPKTGVTEEAHLHCRKCGRVSHPSQGRQSEPKPGKAKVHRRATAFHGSGVSTGWFHGISVPPLSTACSRGRQPASAPLCAPKGVIGETRWPHSASSTSSPPDVPTAPASSSTSMSCATISAPSEKALPDSRIYYAVKANPAPEILRLLAAMGSSFDTASVAEVEMAMDAGAPADRISFGNTIKKERDIARAYAARHPAVCGRLRRGGREDRPRRSRRPRVLPRADRRRRRRMAAVAQVRLRAGDGRRRAAPCQGARPRRLWRVVPCRLAADRPDRLGPRARRRQAGFRHARRRGHRPEDGQYGRRLPDPLPEGRAGGTGLWPGDLLGAAQAFRQRACPRPSSSRAAAWSAMPA